MHVTYDKETERFIAYCKFEERFQFLHANWDWDDRIKKWTTSQPELAVSFFAHCDDEGKEVINALARAKEQATAASRAATTDKVFEAPEGLAYLPYQNAGIEFIITRPNTLLADQPGLGKTIQAVGSMNELRARRTLIVCPASLKNNWAKEIAKWSTQDSFSVGIADKIFPSTESVIINFEILKKFHKELRSRVWDLIVVDEAHNLKNPKSQRTKEVYGGGYGKGRVKPLRGKVRLWLTGTPILNKPIDLFPMCKEFDPQGLGKDWEHFVYRYCNAHEGSFGLDTSGSSNLEELKFKLRSSFMLRRLKSQVLTDLPPKRRQIIELPARGMVKVVRDELSFFEQNMATLEGLNERFNPEEPIDPVAAMALVHEITGDTMSEKAEKLDRVEGLMFESAAVLRKDVAIAKTPMSIEYIKRLLEAEDKVIVFAHHKEVIDMLKEAFPDHACITGETPVKKRQEEVDKFQETATPVFIGNIQAAGVGHTLTASTHVVFVEITWVPAEMSQAEDRAHRIGQLGNVHIHYLVVEGSLEANIIHALIEKEEIIDAALD